MDLVLFVDPLTLKWHVTNNCYIQYTIQVVVTRSNVNLTTRWDKSSSCIIWGKWLGFIVGPWAKSTLFAVTPKYTHITLKRTPAATIQK